jgi:isopentenyl-diphosphate delta-isomerase
MTQDKVVSFLDEQLIVVDKQDNILDYKTKTDCHLGGGLLHRAFSIFIFNSQRQLILQKRSQQKLLWPDFWSNSCCSHPRKGETYDRAARRRLKEELGIVTELKYLYTFQYHVRFGSIGSEQELCAVYIGRSDEPVSINQNEISEYKYVAMHTITGELNKNPEMYTPWFKMEWHRLSSEYLDKIHNLLK